MTLQEIQYKAQGIIHKWRDDDSAPYIEFVEELAHMIVPEPSEDLEEAAKEFAKNAYLDKHNLVWMFKRGAKWQKEQMMQKAVEGEIRGDIRSQEEEPYQIWAESDFLPLDEKFEIGDKVRIIIVKEEEK